MKRLICLISMSVLLFPMVLSASDVTSQEKSDDAAIDRKIKESQQLIAKGVQFFQKNGLEVSAKVFGDDPVWRMGEQFVFIFGDDGTCYSFGDQRNIIWKNLNDKVFSFGEDFLPTLLERAKDGGQISFNLNNALMQAYVQIVKKDGKKYILGAGFYPQSGRYKSIQLVKDAAAVLARTGDIKDLASRINNPQGEFVYGDIYVYLIDFDGVCIANGDTYALVGQNLTDLKTPDGVFRTKDELKIGREKGSGWHEYSARQGGAKKKVYVEKVVNPATKKEYILVSGYFPGIMDDTVRGFLNKAVSFLRENGSTAAFREFSNKIGKFVYGNVTVFVYSMAGEVLADSESPELVGTNMKEAQDSDGKFYVREILDNTERYGKGWISYSAKNAYRVAYVEKVKAPDGDFIVGAGYYPNTQQSRARFMADRAELYLSHHTKSEAFGAFMATGSDFLQGDMHVTVYDQNGVCLVDGLHMQRIWQNDKKLKDDKGKYFFTRIASTATSGGGWVDYNEFGSGKRVFVRGVEKEAAEGQPAETLAVVCGYYN
jgi:hypothetical protein